jgi:hypothetical protein
MAAAIEFDARLDSQGVSSLMRQMRASAKALNISLGNAVKFTAWAVADSLRAAEETQTHRSAGRTHESRQQGV